MNQLTDQQLHRLKHQLQSEKNILLRQLRDNDQFGLKTPIREVLADSSVDNHPADEGTEMFERSKDFALNEHMERVIDQIDRAMDAMEKGNYGMCESCGQPIPFERLEAIPYTPYCVKHAREQFESTDRPVEEQLLARPFGRTSLDEHGEPGFDGEDAWQIVERWGTSNSPAYAEDPGGDYGSLFIEADEPDGYVEPIESFLATDLYGRRASVVRNREYAKYMESMEGDRSLESGSDESM